MSGTDEIVERELQKRKRPMWGVIHQITYGRQYEITEYADFYQNNPRIKASGLTYDEANAMCTLMNAGRDDD